jgi:hypothetical protein
MTQIVGKMLQALGDPTLVATIADAINMRACKPPLAPRELDKILQSVIKRHGA